MADKRSKLIAVRASGTLLPDIILDIVRQSGGRIVDCDDDQSLSSLVDWARTAGLIAGQEEGAVIGISASPTSPETETDHRGVNLPARHRAGGIITPQ